MRGKSENTSLQSLSRTIEDLGKHPRTWTSKETKPWNDWRRSIFELLWLSRFGRASQPTTTGRIEARTRRSAMRRKILEGKRISTSNWTHLRTCRASIRRSGALASLDQIEHHHSSPTSRRRRRELTWTVTYLQSLRKIISFLRERQQLRWHCGQGGSKHPRLEHSPNKRGVHELTRTRGLGGYDRGR